MSKLYFRNMKTGKKYEVINIDKTKGEITLKGEFAQFVEQYDKERFKHLGYVLEKGDDNAIQQGIRS